MKTLLYTISNLGINGDQDENYQRKNIISNQLNIIALGIMLLIFIIDTITVLQNGMQSTSYLSVIILIFISILNLVLNYFGYFKLSRVILVSEGPLILIFFPLVTGVVIDEFYFWFQYLPTGLSVLPFLLYSINTEHRKIIFILLVYLMLVAFMCDILDLFASTELGVKKIVQDNRLFYKVSSIAIFLFVNLALFYGFNLLNKFQIKLLQAQNDLDVKNKLLARQNKDLHTLNATKDKFFRIIGHDLKNPISNIISFSELLEHNFQNYDNDRIAKIVSSMRETSLHGFRILNNLLDWARTQTRSINYDPDMVDLYKLIIENVGLVSHAAMLKNITIYNDLPKSTMVWGDINMLNTIIRNLLSNAVKFSYQGSKIIIGYKSDIENNIVFVEDFGVGMSTELQSKLFRIDENITIKGTDNEDGTGLGLIVSKEFVELQNGRIWVDSKENEGTTFYFSLPKQN